MSRSSDITVSAFGTILIAVMPKCPICWLGLMSVFGVGSVINAYWLKPVVAVLLFLSVSALLVRGRRRGGYGPFLLGLMAAILIYMCKFGFDYDVGVYLGGGMLVGTSIWNALPKHQVPDSVRCHCQAHP